MIETLVAWAVLGFLAAVINIKYCDKMKNAYRNEYNLRLKAEEENSMLRKELKEIEREVRLFVMEHNSWHDRKIAFYYDKDGWHCCYADEIPEGDVVSEQEEISDPNENNNENNQSI